MRSRRRASAPVRAVVAPTREAAVSEQSGHRPTNANAPRSPRPGRPRSPLASAASPGPTNASSSPGRPDGVKGVYPSTPSTRSHSTSTSAASRPSPNAFSSPCSKRTSGRIPFNPGIPHRQWLRVHQPTGRGAAQQAARRVSRPQVQCAQTPRIRRTPSPISPFLNHHRPCLFPTEQRDHKGKMTSGSSNPFPMPRRSSNPASPSNNSNRLCPKRPRRRPRSQCRPRRTVPNHRLPVGNAGVSSIDIARRAARAIASTLASTELTCLSLLAPSRSTFNPSIPRLNALNLRIGKQAEAGARSWDEGGCVFRSKVITESGRKFEPGFTTIFQIDIQ